MKRNTPFFIGLVAFVSSALWVAPWGEFPVNDDWQYAHVAKRLAEEGRFHVDVPIAPTLVLQSLAAWPVIKVFGFSHLALRFLTMALAALFLWLVHQLLLQLKIRGEIIALSLLVIVFNPLFQHFAFSFMTEIYGLIPALLGAVLWFHPSRTRWKHPVTALVIGSSFWVRQLSALIFPALVIGLILAVFIRRGRKPAFEQAVKLIPASLLFFAVVGAYFVWASATGNLKPQFTGPLGNILQSNIQQWIIQPWITIPYLTAFLIPFFPVVLCWTRRSGWPRLRPLLILLSVGIFFYLFTNRRGEEICTSATHVCRVFPILHNVLSPFSVGPLTLSDTYGSNRILIDSKAWDAGWRALTIILLILAPIWISFGKRTRDLLRAKESLSEGRLEFALFALTLLAMNVIILARSFNGQVFDRYHFTTFLSGLFLLALLAEMELAHRAFGFRRKTPALLLLAPTAIYSVLGSHDYFRWNEVRWSMHRDAVASGIPVGQIDGGFEINGWKAVTGACPAPECNEKLGWFRRDLPYRMTMRAEEGYEVLQSAPVPTWLRPMPPILLSRKTN